MVSLYVMQLGSKNLTLTLQKWCSIVYVVVCNSQTGRQHASLSGMLVETLHFVWNGNM